MNKNLKTTLKFSLATVIGASVLCGATEMVAKWCFGIELPVQSQVDFVKSYVGWNRVFVAIVEQAVLLMPAFEEIFFRWFLWKLPLSLAHKWSGGGRIARVVGGRVRSLRFRALHRLRASRDQARICADRLERSVRRAVLLRHGAVPPVQEDRQALVPRPQPYAVQFGKYHRIVDSPLSFKYESKV